MVRSTNVVPQSSYDRSPATRLGPEHTLWRGDDAYRQLRETADSRGSRPVVVVDTYPGVDLPGLVERLTVAFDGFEVIDVEREAAKSAELVDALISANLTNDRVFGVMSHATVDLFYDHQRLAAISERIASRSGGVVVVGWGAVRTVIDPSMLVLADLARWEIQRRYRAGGTNWRSANADEDILRKYKRGFFVEWRAADRHKRTLFDRIDFALDINGPVATAGLISGNAFREGLATTVSGPFRVVPFFDPGVWGGQWMKRVCGLDADTANYAWCFDCVPEEDSLQLDFSGERFELPSIDLVFTHPRELLGELTYARFGAEFPIRFDFLDTMGGANLSLQVHPLTDYIRETFGMSYTQDESYYLLDASEDAKVYLGLRTGADAQQMLADLQAAQRGEISFPAEKFVNTFPARKHDHFLIPAGTVHCSGAGSMVLEISATPFIFTFKMWDWDRVGLDNLPRPIHLEHARDNIQWDRDTEWTETNLVDQVRVVGQGEGWTEEVTGLHELEFIEVRRHWFTGPVPHHTDGTVNVLNLVEGAEAVVTSPTEAFAPFVVHYAETFIVPAQVGPYVIAPSGRGIGQRLGTVKAYVRGTGRTLTGSDRRVPVLEIGGTHVTAALVDPDAAIVVESHRVHLDSAGSSTQILDSLTDIAQRLGGGYRCWAVAIPGPFDYQHGIGRYTRVDKFDSLAEVDLGSALTARLDGRPQIVFVNDADAFGIGEVLAGAGRGHRRAICLTLGTGIGSAFIADGKPVNDGPTVPPDGSVHLLQWDGDDIEETVSRRAIRRQFTELTREQLDVHEIAERARQGDPAALHVFTVCFRALGGCIAPWVASFDATALILGGSIAGSFDLIEAPLHEGLRDGHPASVVAARPAAHPTTSPLIGAAHHARRVSAAVPRPTYL